MSMPIEEQLSVNNLNVISDFILKMQENSPNMTNYYVNYRRPLDTKIILSTSVNQTSSYNQFISPYYYCGISLIDGVTQEDYTSENFNFTQEMSECTLETNGSMDIPLTYDSQSSIYSKVASNMYSDNYVDIEQYNTILQPSPSPENPTTNGFDNINPYYWLLPSFLLMLILMYRFIGSIFPKTKE